MRSRRYFFDAINEAVASGECNRGVLTCGSSLGVAMAANKVKGVRAASIGEPYSAKLSRQHNDCNVICFGERLTGWDMVEECLDVRVGKTPYLRFDKNDYSVPHTHVQRNLSVIASDERVRIVDPEVPDAVLADHPRTFDRDQRVEQEGHLRALVEEKRRAHQSRGFDRLFSVVPAARVIHSAAPRWDRSWAARRAGK